VLLAVVMDLLTVMPPKVAVAQVDQQMVQQVLQGLY
jgi:hypothetical protein